MDGVYPRSEFGGTGAAVPSQIRFLAHGIGPERSAEASSYEMKQSTMPDTPNEGADLFYGVRPSIVVDEAAVVGTFSQEGLLQGTAPKVAGLDVKMSNEFQDQFISQYAARVFPWALNYDCGGADYPDRFADLVFLEKARWATKPVRI